MSETLRTPTASAPVDQLEPPPAAKRYRFLTDRRLAWLLGVSALLGAGGLVMLAS